MPGAREVGVLLAVFVAQEAALAGFFWIGRGKTEDLALIAAAFDVFLAGAVAGFATLGAGARMLQGCFPVRRRLEVLVDLLMAGLAGIDSHKMGVFDDRTRRRSVCALFFTPGRGWDRQDQRWQTVV